MDEKTTEQVNLFKKAAAAKRGNRNPAQFFFLKGTLSLSYVFKHIQQNQDPNYRKICPPEFIHHTIYT